MIALILPFFEKLINRLIQLDADTLACINKINGKRIAIEITGLPIQFTISFNADKIKLQPFLATDPDAAIKGMPLALVRLLLSPQANTLLFKKIVVVEGDIGLLQTLQQILQQLDIDWEEYLSGFIGDIPAHLIGNRLREVKHWQEDKRVNLQRNLTEYLQEELQYFPVHEQLNDFMAEVDELRDGVERLQARYDVLASQKDKA